jgi:hypothetical protein
MEWLREAQGDLYGKVNGLRTSVARMPTCRARHCQAKARE